MIIIEVFMKNNKTEKIICKYCNSEFISHKSRKSKYCSVECYNKDRKKMIKYESKTCPICGKLFKTYHHNQKYCSSKCCGISQQKKIICECDNCGKRISRKISDISKQNFCSLNCRYEYYKWNDSDCEIIKNNYKKIKPKELQSMLSKTYSLKAINNQAIKLGVSSDRSWSKEEEEIVLNNYEKISRNELLKLLPQRTSISIYHKAKELGLNSHYYLSRRYSEDDIEYLRENYLNKTNEELGEYLNHSPNGISQYLNILGLHRPIDTNQLCYKELASFIRARIQSWRNNIREKNNYVCEITGSRTNIVVHHCRGFNLLLNEAIESIGFEINENFSDYDIDKLEELVEVFLDIQEKYKEYVCVNEDVHRLFHNEYRYGNNTMEQWQEFVDKYKKGYYKIQAS